MPPKGKTPKYIDGGKWKKVCFSCPLTDCDSLSYTCPIKVALTKKIEPARMVEINEMAGPGQPKRFRKLVWKEQVT